ncbi:hypothetical protein U1E44_10710 [Arenibacter sp. GZD96]|uniref:hypothetical protein n=1 Tax=Aurantibrevibacter litoralis TaxID=3106030 RepID=UPI002AFEBF14|nr:hypothetical protein [Arenibacter sp. GZD-96]MEA1786563.1 hypothetical protein [Arenibacter sp. GZD-96]
MTTNNTRTTRNCSNDKGVIFFRGSMQCNVVLGCFLWVTYLVSYGQKITHKTLIDPETTSIHLNAANVYQVQLATRETKEMNIEAFIDGEYSGEQLVQITKNGGTSVVSVEFQPNFEMPNDKLSAHKVLSVALKIEVPQGKRFYLYGSEANVSITGVYSHLKVVLNDGNCTLYHVQAPVVVQTQSGVITTKGAYATIEAFSKYGAVFGEAHTSGKYSYHLSTVTGNIYLNKTE